MSDHGFLSSRAKPFAVVALIVAGGIVLLGSTQTWLTAEIASGQVEVAGADAVPLVRPLALAVLALALVLTLVGRAPRYVLGALVTATGAALTLVIVPVAGGGSISAVASVVTEHTGLAGEQAVADLVSDITPSPWPIASLVFSIIAAVAGVFVLATAHAWRRGGRRFEQASARMASGPVDAIDSWDELSHGEDPTR